MADNKNSAEYSLIEKKKRGGTPKTCHEAVREPGVLVVRSGLGVSRGEKRVLLVLLFSHSSNHLLAF